MLLTQEVERVWQNKIKQYYINKGYKFTKIGDKFKVVVDDLPQGSHVLIEVLCDYCKKEIISKPYSKYCRDNINGKIHTDCCTKCSTIKRKESNLKIFGVESPTQIPEIMEKIIVHKRTDFNFVKQHIEKENYRLIFIDDINFSVKSPLILQCENGHFYKTDFNHFYYRKQRCKTCHNDNRRIDGNLVYNEFLENGLIPQFKPEDYQKSNIPLPYICSKHPELGVQYKAYSTIKDHKGCRLCGYESMKKTIEYVREEFLKHGFVLLENEYIDCSTRMKCICEKHPEKIQYKSLSTVINTKNNKYHCRYCYNRKKENSNLWKGGISDIVSYLRKSIYEWKFNSLKKYDFKCLLSKQEKNLVVHHLINYSAIIKELIETNIAIYPNLTDYTEEELDVLKSKCLELHYKYGLGVCLHKNIHKLFHDLYGRRNNTTPEQFEEFKIRYKFGEFDEILQNKKIS